MSEATEKRKQLRATLKWSLRPVDYRSFEGRDGLKAWFETQLEGLMAYGLMDKTQVSVRALQFTNDHYVKGYPLVTIANRHHISARQVIRDVNTVLDCILDGAPHEILAAMTPKAYIWHVKPCPNCGGSLFWDDIGAYGGDGEYCCLMCSRRYDTELVRIGKV